MKKLFALVLAFCLVLTMLPTPAFAEGEPETPVCTCDIACTAENKNTECPVCGAEGSTPGSCGKYVAPEPEEPQETEKPVTPEEQEKPTEPTPAQKVQTLINALPDAVTAENRETVETQLTAIDEAKLPLTDEERATLDFAKYDAAIAAINVLDDMAGAEVPKSILDKKVTVWFYCSVILPDGEPYGTCLVDDDGKVEFPSDPGVTGYEFLGWYTEPNGGGKMVDDTTIFTEDTNLYAYMKPIYTITFDLRGGTLPEDVASTATTNAEGKLDSLPTPTREGYEFVGWFINDALRDDINSNTIFKENTTLHARWGKTVETLALSLSGYGVGQTVSGLSLTSGDQDVAVDKYSVSEDEAGKNVLDGSHAFTREKTYYITVKLNPLQDIYYEAKAFTLNGVADLYFTQDGSMTVVFQLPTVGCVITLDPNGGTVSSTTVTTDADGKLTALPTPDREDCTFDGWYTAKEGGEKVTADKTYSENTTLYAHWKANTYTVRFDANGGDGTMADQTMTYGQTTKLTANAFTRKGYAFTGWNTQPDGKGIDYANEAEVSNLTTSGTVTLYAHWEANTYTVHFDANGGEGTMANQTMTCDKSEGLKANAFALDGHIFRGWNTQPDGTGTHYADGETVQNLTTEKDTVVTLFAQWELIVNEVNLTLSGHGIDKRVDDVKITTEEPITFNGAYGSAWGIVTNQKTLKTLEGKRFRADTQYYLWAIFSPEEGCTLANLAAKDVTLDGIAALSLEDMQGSKMALFRLPVIYTITVTAGKNGSVSSDSTINAKGVITVFEGEDVTIKITPDKDYVIYRLTVDGRSVKTAQTYTFENIQQSHTLKARFLKNGTNPKTGDSFPLVPAIAVLLLSTAALAAVVIIARKKEKN